VACVVFCSVVAVLLDAPCHLSRCGDAEATGSWFVVACLRACVRCGVSPGKSLHRHSCWGWWWRRPWGVVLPVGDITMGHRVLKHDSRCENPVQLLDEQWRRHRHRILLGGVT
jgi:hypothetical protein